MNEHLPVGGPILRALFCNLGIYGSAAAPVLGLALLLYAVLLHLVIGGPVP